MRKENGLPTLPGTSNGFDARRNRTHAALSFSPAIPVQ
jgi:hypothetical protein